MTKRTLLLVPLLANVIFANAQNITISGYISEKNSGERLLGGVIVVPEQNVCTTSNTFGFFSLTIP